MKKCYNCYWYGRCGQTTRCEYYDPVYGGEKTVVAEYRQSLREREAEAQEIINEMNDGED